MNNIKTDNQLYIKLSICSKSKDEVCRIIKHYNITIIIFCWIKLMIINTNVVQVVKSIMDLQRCDYWHTRYVLMYY